MKKQYLLGIDIGTSAVKLALFSKALGNRPVAIVGEEYPTHYPAQGYAEQAPDDWWQAICRGIPRLLCEAGIDAAEIAGIGLDGQSWSAVAVDKDGRVLCPSPIWFDTRSKEICEELERTLGEGRCFATSCNPPEPTYTFPKILWYKKHTPTVYENAVSILQSNGFIVYRLTGKLSCDRSQGYGFSCFDMRRGAWDEALCREAGVDPRLLPPLFDCHEIVGTVTEAAAAACGLAVGTPVVAGGLDSACESLGAGVYAAGQVQEQGGQSGGMSICMNRPIADERLILCRHVVPDHFLLQGGTVGGGAILRWFEQTFPQKAPERGEFSPFAEADKAAETIAPGADGLILLPYLSGERSPIWDPAAKGVYFGLDYAKTRAHFHRANLEAAAFALRHNLEVAAEAGAKVTTLRAAGGSAKSPLWTQIKSDVTGCAVEVPEAYSTAAFGAAILAGVAVGFYESFAEAAACIKVTRTHVPNPDNKAVYDRTYANYRELYDRLMPLMHK